ncbi:NAD(P)-dependent oxidoreductase [Microbacterium gubbeenense]|uniref:NAD(P)-dependent oxidoreductase n=1 Tax=Microbacterium gubbeenense TaxID=159896 RepID=UPI003F9A6754
MLRDAVEAAGATLSALEDAEGIVYFGNDDPAELQGLLHDGIRWVQLPHAGVEPWSDAGVVVSNPVFSCAAGIYGYQVAEHALALMLAGARQLHVHARARSWGAKNTRVFSGSTVVLVGIGGIGRALIDLLAPFNVRIIAVSDSYAEHGRVEVVRREQYREVLPEADYVVLAAPSTPETHHMIDEEALASMRDTAWLINVARGSLVDSDALLAAVRAEQIGGAALDVTDPEPLPESHPLWDEQRVLITPHVANPADAYWAGLSARTRENAAHFVRANSVDELRGALVAIVDPDRGY